MSAPKKPIERVEEILEDAQLAFWAVVAKAVPEAESGDLAPDMVFAQDDANRRAITSWIRNNAMTLEEEEASENLYDAAIGAAERGLANATPEEKVDGVDGWCAAANLYRTECRCSVCAEDWCVFYHSEKVAPMEKIRKVVCVKCRDARNSSPSGKTVRERLVEECGAYALMTREEIAVAEAFVDYGEGFWTDDYLAEGDVVHTYGNYFLVHRVGSTGLFTVLEGRGEGEFSTLDEAEAHLLEFLGAAR